MKCTRAAATAAAAAPTPRSHMPITRAYIVRHNFGSSKFFDFKDAEDNLNMTVVEGREAGKFEITTDLVNFEFGYGGVRRAMRYYSTRAPCSLIRSLSVYSFISHPEVNFFLSLFQTLQLLRSSRGGRRKEVLKKTQTRQRLAEMKKNEWDARRHYAAKNYGAAGSHSCALARVCVVC